MVKKSWMMLMDGLGKIAAGIGIVTAGSILRPGRGVPSFWEFSQVRWPEIFHLPAISFPPSNLFHQTTSTHKISISETQLYHLVENTGALHTTRLEQSKLDHRELILSFSLPQP